MKIRSIIRFLFNPFIALFRLNREIFRPSNLFHLDNTISTFLLLFLFWVLGNIQFEFLNPIGDAFSDVEITDVMYGHFDKNESFRESKDGTKHFDTTIAIVNIGLLPRSGIAQLLNTVNKGNPKAVGIDAFFRNEKNGFQDALLADALKNTKNLVMVNEGKKYNDSLQVFEELRTSHPTFNQYAINGFANMVLDENSNERGMKVCRWFLPKIEIKDSTEQIPSFGAVLSNLYKPDATALLDERNREEEYINYFGNIHVWNFFLPKNYTDIPNETPFYDAYDYTQLFHPDFDPIVFKNKIVLFGYLGERIDRDEGTDKFYTPLNHKYIGKANKDMYGVVVHANIISTIIHNKFIDRTGDVWVHLVGLFFLYMAFASFRAIYVHHKVWYDGLSKVLSLCFAMFVISIQGYIFLYFDYQIRLGAIYLGGILLAGDFLEIYLGLIKNYFKKLLKKFTKFTT